MSSPNLRVILSPEAQDDYEDIQLYTIQTYGMTQWQGYEERLAAAITLLAHSPYAGTARDELRPGYRVFPLEQHRIIYFVTGDAVKIVRILHRSRDIFRHV